MLYATINNACIRKAEKKTGKNGSDYILVTFEDEDCNNNRLVDKDMSRLDMYKRDAIVTFTISIDEGRKFTNIRIEDCKVKKGK